LRRRSLNASSLINFIGGLNSNLLSIDINGLDALIECLLVVSPELLRSFSISFNVLGLVLLFLFVSF
jgi:hypothetical protein